MKKLLSYKLNCAYCKGEFIGKASLHLVVDEKGQAFSVCPETKLSIGEGDVELRYEIGEFTLDFQTSFVCPDCQKTNYICISLPKEIAKL